MKLRTRCLRHSSGSARAAADYLVGERDSAGRVRPGVEILRGNPDHVDGQVTGLAQDYRTLAATLRELWR